MNEPSDQNQITCYYFGNIIINKKDRTCCEFKIYEFADLKLQEMKYESRS